MSSTSIMERTEIAALLPYGSSFLFVDEVISHDQRHILTATHYQPSHPLIDAHFAGGTKLVPGVLLVEQACQSALLLCRLLAGADARQPMVVGRIQAVFEAPARCPCRLQTEVSLAVVQPERVGFSAMVLLDKIEIARIKGAAAMLPASEIAA